MPGGTCSTPLTLTPSGLGSLGQFVEYRIGQWVTLLKGSQLPPSQVSFQTAPPPTWTTEEPEYLTENPFPQDLTTMSHFLGEWGLLAPS